MAIKKIKSEGPAKIFISASFNNTLINICDSSGGTIAWCSSGASGFKGTRKSTPFAKQQQLLKLQLKKQKIKE